MEAAIIVLGRAFLAYPPTSRCARLCSNQLILHDYYQQVGRVVYRIVVLLVAKARDVLLDLTAAPRRPAACVRYTQYCAPTGLRRRAERRAVTAHADFYRQMRLVMQWLSGDNAPRLGLPALNGWFLSSASVPDLDAADLSNCDLLAPAALLFVDDRHVRRRVEYQHLGAEDLGADRSPCWTGSRCCTGSLLAVMVHAALGCRGNWRARFPSPHSERRSPMNHRLSTSSANNDRQQEDMAVADGRPML